MGRMLAGDYLEGSIKPISREAVNKFKEYALILKNKGEFLKDIKNNTVENNEEENQEYF